MMTKTHNLSDYVTSLSLGSVLLMIGAAVYAAPPQPPAGLFKDSHIPAHVNIPPNAKAGKTRFVEVDQSQLGADRLDLGQLGGRKLTAKRQSSVSNENGSSVWIGRIEGESNSEVALARSGQALAGTIRVGKKLYSLRYSGDGVHTLSEVSASDPLPEPEPPVPAYDKPSKTTSTTSSTATTGSADTGELLDVLVVYTPASRLAQGGVDGMQALIALAIAETNQAYLNSGVPTRVRLAHSAELNYAESGSIFTDLARLQASNESGLYMEEVHALRDAYSADLVTLIEEDNQYCGTGYQMTEVSTSFAPHAFNVVASQCAAGYYSFGHELGHNLGLTHDHLNSDGQSAYAYSYGFQDPSESFRTIMAYDCYGGCPRVPHFSNPQVIYAGLPTGVDYALDPVNAADNALTLAQTTPMVASFRDSSVAGPPAAPTDLRGFAITQDRIELNWKDNSTNELGYLLERSEDGINFTQVASLLKNVSAFADTGLAMGMSYDYRVKAYNAAGDSTFSEVITVATPDPSLTQEQLATGEVPVAGTVTGDYSQTWSAAGYETIAEVSAKGGPSNRYGYLEHEWTFDLQPASSHSFDVAVRTQIIGGGDSFTFAFSTDGLTFADMVTYQAYEHGWKTFDLPAGLAGRVYVRVMDNARNPGEDSSHSLSIDQMHIRSSSLPGELPQPPSGLTAIPASADSLALSWSDNAWNESGFRIESSADGSNWSWVANVSADTTGFVHSGLTVGSVHQYRVSAFNDNGASEPAGPVSATVADVAPIDLSIMAIKVKGKMYAELNWSAAASQTMDVYRDGSALVTGIPNDGSYVDPAILGSGSFLYQVCEGGSDTLCSDQVSLSF